MNEGKITGACCGRPMQYATESKCNWSCGPTSEYCGCALGRIKKDADPCKACAVIPSLTVETPDGISNLANCFVHVTSINTTYYIDDKHRPMIIWAGEVEVSLPADVTTSDEFTAFVRSFNLRSQFLYVKYYSKDLSKNVIDAFYFDKSGKLYWAYELEEVTGVN